ncbi:unnamed protein product [Rhizophagus irregularis]|nr:unnamed protein product [Rhizophagus irregularis]
MSNPFRYIYNKVQENDIKKLARKSGATQEGLPPALNNHETAALALKALKRDKNMPALVFHWDPAGFNDVATSPNNRNGVVGQNLAAVITNLTASGARNYNNIIFTFPNGASIGTWKQQIDTNIPWVRSQTGIPNVIHTVTRVNRVTEHDTGTPSSAFDLEDFSDVFN